MTDEMMQDMLQTAKRLFDRGMITGSTGNISMRDEDTVYLSPSGSCLGFLAAETIARMSLTGDAIEGKATKEAPLHLALYRADPTTQAVIHTHSVYTTLFSCRTALSEQGEELMAYTPYLKMQTKGKIGIIPYHAPGSKELFAAFATAVSPDTHVYLLQNHGMIVAAADMNKAFYLAEELEMSARLAYLIQTGGKDGYHRID